MKPEDSIFSAATERLSVGLLLLPDSNLLSLAACVDPLRAANRRADKKLFEWTFLTPTDVPVALTSGIEISGQPISAKDSFDLLIVVAGFNLMAHAERPLLRVLRDLVPRVRAFGGVDGGSWILARAGLLNGQTATTHWEDLEEFADVFPDIHVVRDRFTISGPFITTGGAAPAIDLMLHLIRTRHGQQLAEGVASALLYQGSATGSEPQVPVLTTRLKREAPRLAEVMEQMAKRMEDSPPIADFASGIGLSQRALEMMFQRQIGLSPGAYFLNLRLEEARRLVLDTGLSAQVISLRTGFSSQATFARAFRRAYGMSARDLRRLHRP